MVDLSTRLDIDEKRINKLEDKPKEINYIRDKIYEIVLNEDMRCKETSIRNSRKREYKYLRRKEYNREESIFKEIIVAKFPKMNKDVLKRHSESWE